MRALDSEDNYNLLFTGPPATAKTLFLLGILDMRNIINYRNRDHCSWMDWKENAIDAYRHHEMTRGIS